MHEQWLDLIPYYVNRTLPDAERAALEHHLTTCEICRRALEEWHTVAGAVYSEADRWAREAPTLSAQVRANLGLPASSNGHGHYQAAFDPNRTFSVYTDRQSRRKGGRARLPLTLAAAAMVILTFGALILYIANRDDESPSRLSADAEVVTLTPTRTPRPSTLGAVTVTPVSSQRDPSATPDDLGILPLAKTPSPTPLPNGIAAPATPYPYASPIIPTPTIYWPGTPTAVYQYGIGSGYVMVTTEQIGTIPAGTRVRVSHAWYDGSGWLYGILTEDDLAYAEVRDWQIAYAPDYTPGPPPDSAYQSAIGMGYLMVTTEQIGALPAGTRVRISYASYNGYEWLYAIAPQNGEILTDAHEWQIAYAPDVTPGPTPTPYFNAYFGSGTYLRTTEQVGAIPAGTRVQIGGTWFDGIEWHYNIVAEDGITTAEARTAQLTYDTQPAPVRSLTPTFTPTAIHPAALRIDSFSASPDPAARGGSITLAWSVSGASQISITRLQEQTGVFVESIADNLAQNGTFTYTLPDYYIAQIKFILITISATGERAEAYTTVTITCPYGSSLTNDCPITQQMISAAYQPFENGYMVWRGDTNMIYVLYKSGALEKYPDTWVEGETFDVGETPPTGKTQPTRGFGKVWATQSDVRTRLGWALSAESGYTAQWESHQLWMGWNQTEGDHFTLLDTRVVHQTVSGWTF